MSLSETSNPAVDVVSFGCRLNAHESEIVACEAARAGVSDVVVVNTCAVTNEAVAQARQTIRKLRRERPERRIVVTGCAAQTQPHMFAGMDEVDRVIGNDDKLRSESWRATRRALDADHAPTDKIAVSDIMSAASRPAAGVSAPARPRAYVQIQNGCDHRCTFCIIPFGRGNSRSVSADDVVRQVRRLVESGNGEVVLTGVDLTSYGADIAGASTLGSLVKRLLREIPELKRLRLSSIDSIEVDRDLLDVIATEERLMPHLHLSLQSGDDLILKRMKRRHSRADAVRFCAQVRALRPDVTFGADIIAGFPTETDAMFCRSLELVEACDLSFVHAFPYSPRPGTPAARMPQVVPGLIKDRARRLREAGDRALQWRLAAEVGAQRSVLIESPMRGRTEHFIPVAVHGETPGAVRQMTIAGEDGQRLLV
jgi:threonylcarbamoyladenosine tRNA methylthiotransferase MtaB